MRLGIIVGAGLLAVVTIAFAAPLTITGPARVIDGDTIETQGQRIRLIGYDAPEKAQRCKADGEWYPCGRMATEALAAKIGGRNVTCAAGARDRYGRPLAVCKIGGIDLNAWMASQGWGAIDPRFDSEYGYEVAAAREARVGIWRGAFVPPWEWRRGKRL